MKKILILFAHPALQNSRVHRALAASVSQVEGVTFHDLYEVYPEFDVDPIKEQLLLEAHDIVIMQFPFYWYSTPALLKQWQDIVLTFGWAFGPKGDKLKGKSLMLAISSGGQRNAYHAEGYNRFSINELISPLNQTAHLCQLNFLPPFVIHGSLQLDDTQIQDTCSNYINILKELGKGQLTPENTKDRTYMNDSAYTGFIHAR